jgi:hypothetical protein
LCLKPKPVDLQKPLFLSPSSSLSFPHNLNISSSLEDTVP